MGSSRNQAALWFTWRHWNLGSTGTAKTPPYPYRVPRGYGYCRGTAACVPPAYPFSAKKNNFWYGFGTGRVRVGSDQVRVRYGAKPNGVVFGLKLQPYLASQPLDSYLSLQPDSLSSALCLSLPPPPVSLVFSPLLSVSVSALGKRLRATERKKIWSSDTPPECGVESLSRSNSSSETSTRSHRDWHNAVLF